mgnify:CR=1 FL=1
MAIRWPKLAICLLERCKDRTRVTSQARAKILGAIKGTALLKKVDTAHNFDHMVTRAHHIQRKLRVCYLTLFRYRSNGGQGVLLTRRQRL